MKITNYNLPAFAALRRGKRFVIGALRTAGRSADFQSAVSRISNPQTPQPSCASQAGSLRYSRLETCATGTGGFTMIEIALCLAIIGFALVSILLVLPSGMNTQRDTREETIINQDASELMEAIRDGTRGVDDLTNYVYAITNYVAIYNANGVLQGPIHHWGYTYGAASYDNGSDVPAMHITNGLRIIGLLSTPEFTDPTYGSGLPNDLGVAIPSLYLGGVSNHVVAYIRSVSGLAAEKPPQNNEIMQQDTFGYRVVVVNAPTATDTNAIIDLFNWPLWKDGSYGTSAPQVFYKWTRWRAISNTVAGNPAPGQPIPTNLNWQSSQWVEVPYYPLALTRNQRELRLYYEWPQLPNGNVGGFRQNFRMSIAGQLVETNYAALYPNISPLYFYEAQFFSSTP